MIPYVLNAVLLTTTSWLLMEWGLVGRPVVGIPWTTPPVIGHWLVTGGDWRAAVWGVLSIVLSMAVWWPFARAYGRRRLAPVSASASPSTPASASTPEHLR